MNKWILTVLLVLLNAPEKIMASESTSSMAAELAANIYAKQNNVLLDRLQVDSVKPVQWPDSSLGCPQSGMKYMQVVTPGFLVTLLDLSNRTNHSVHVGAGKAIVCDKPASAQLQTEKKLRFGRRWQQSQQAQKLLADRLAVAPNEIRIVGMRNVSTDMLPDRCKGEGGVTYSQLIELDYQKKLYRYVVKTNRLVACD